jgi:hypothetical protein
LFDIDPTPISSYLLESLIISENLSLKTNKANCYPINHSN